MDKELLRIEKIFIDKKWSIRYLLEIKYNIIEAEHMLETYEGVGPHRRDFGDFPRISPAKDGQTTLTDH
jgi:hypothetical protein